MLSTQTLMIQGTTSDAGKSTLVTALCRWLARQGIRVAPFKPQNMALNSAVTANGGEIGRAQAVQAMAAGLAPHTDMNPVLLKPSSDKNAQIVIHGRAIGNMNAIDYHRYKTVAMSAVLESHARLCLAYDKIIVEGAGSPAEINLRDRDIANMGFAEAVDCPVILIADIDRGGVFAHLAGTLALLSPSEQDRIQGFVINRFRGDITLLQSGLDWLERYTGKPVFGVLPYLHGLHLEAEDAVPNDDIRPNATRDFHVIVPVLPHISNHTDFDPLRLHPRVRLEFIGPGKTIPPADLIILPGSKNVRADLDWLRRQGWETAIKRHLRYGGKLIGICGGFQMLGNVIHDPDGIEDNPGTAHGLSFFAMETTLRPDKCLRNVQGRLALNDVPITGYEIHAGISRFHTVYRPAIELPHGKDGVISEDDAILGTYLHGIFESTSACDELLAWAGLHDTGKRTNYRDTCAASIDLLADCVDRHLDTTHLRRLLNLHENCPT